MKLIINLDSTSLGASGCILNYIRTTIGEVDNPELGAYKSVMGASAIYGVGVHKFLDTMFRTGGHIPTARNEAKKSFELPKLPASEKQTYLEDYKHFLGTCYNTWTQRVEEDGTFELFTIPQDCYWCNGKGAIEIGGTMSEVLFTNGVKICDHCSGTGKVVGPASELTFRIPFYEDDFIIVYLCGTIDNVGKIKGGCYAIRDWKTTSSWRKDYIDQYDLSRQLRIYTLACKMMARNEPDSILGKVGATNMGAFIEVVRLKAKTEEVEFERSNVMQLSSELPLFEMMLKDYCKKLSSHIQAHYFPKEGILNGSCTTLYGKCRFWNVCKSGANVATVLLNREFKRVIYDPLNFNNEGE